MKNDADAITPQEALLQYFTLVRPVIHLRLTSDGRKTTTFFLPTSIELGCGCEDAENSSESKGEVWFDAQHESYTIFHTSCGNLLTSFGEADIKKATHNNHPAITG